MRDVPGPPPIGVSVGCPSARNLPPGSRNWTTERPFLGVSPQFTRVAPAAGARRRRRCLIHPAARRVRLYGHARPHHRLHLHAPAQDRQLHAGDDGLPDALLPRRPLLGRPSRQGSRRRRGRRRQPDVHRARRVADARRRHDDAGLARRRAAATRNARSLVFNQSQVLSTVVGLAFLAVSMAFRTPTRAALSADAATAASAAGLPALFPAGDGRCSLAWWRWPRRCAASGTSSPGMVVQTATVIINIVLAPVLMFGWGTGRPMGVAGAAVASLIAVAIGVVWLSTYFFGREGYLRFVATRHEAAVPALEGHAEDRTAGRRRVRDDGRLPDAGLRAGAAVRRRRASRLRHRHARGTGAVHAGRGARLLGGAGGRPERRRPARRRASRRCSRTPA